MSKSKRERSDVPGATAVEEPTEQEQNVGTPNGVGTNAPGEPSLLPVNQNGEGNGDRKPKRVETRAQRFRRLATRRYPKAVKAIVALAPLANKAQYESTELQRAFVVAKLEDALLRVKSAFSGTVSQTIAPEPLPD